MCTLSHLRSLWFALLQSQVIARGIPVPGSPFSDDTAKDGQLSGLSATELECLVARALQLHRAWTSPRPRHTSFVRFSVSQSSFLDQPVSPNPNLHSAPTSDGLQTGRPSLRCLALYFLPGRGNRYLVTLLRREQPAPRYYEVLCWDIAPRTDVHENGNTKTIQSRCVARYSCTGLLAACINADVTHPASLALTQHIEA